MVLGTNVRGTRIRSRLGEFEKLVPNWSGPVQKMTFVIHTCFEKTIRKEIKSGSFKARGPSRDEDGQEVRND